MCLIFIDKFRAYAFWFSLNAILLTYQKNRSQFKTVAFGLSIIAIVFSGITLWDSIFRSSIDIFIGKQVRLHVMEHKIADPKPIIILSLSCVNYGGQAKVILDSKLLVRIFSGEELRGATEFFSERGVDNLLEVEGLFKQYIASPIPVTGKSMATRQFVYAPSLSWKLPDFTEPVRVEFDLFVKYPGENWDNVGTYEIDSLRGVWQGLMRDTTYKSDVCLVKKVD